MPLGGQQMSSDAINDIRRFTFGDCHVLAREISRRTGWPIYAFGPYGYPDRHAFVVTPDGHAIDVKGKRSIEALCEEWEMRPESIIPASWRRDLVAFHSTVNGRRVPRYGRRSYYRARVVAEQLLAEIA